MPDFRYPFSSAPGRGVFRCNSSAGMLYCVQLSAVNSIGMRIIRDHMAHCAADALERFTDAIDQYLK